MKARTYKACQDLENLTKVWASKVITETTKILTFKPNLKLMLLYKSEMWRLTKIQCQKCKPLSTDSLGESSQLFIDV